MVVRSLSYILIAMVICIPAQAASLDAARVALAEAEQLRAAEFAPEHYQSAKERLEEAQALLAANGDSNKIAELLETATVQARQAAELAQRFSETFAGLVESRDRLQLTGEEFVRKDLAERSESEFMMVVKAAESGAQSKAKRLARQARTTIHAAQVVAAREQFVRPITKIIAAARKVKAREYAPKSFQQAIDIEKKLTHLIKANPDAQTQAHALSQQGQQAAQRAMRIANLGTMFSRRPETLEAWIDDQDARLTMLGKILNIRLNRSQTPEEQFALLKQAVQDMQASYEARLRDADAQVKELSKKLAKYEGELSNLAAVRRKLQIRREAEAKIKRLTRLFDPEAADILLTPEADVILRLKSLRFRSGSSVIPPEAYALLDNVVKAIEIFPDRAIRVEGHTDSIGSQEYNQILSERRANAVKEYLVEQMGGDTRAISAVGFGEEHPIANNETAEGRGKNRRIDIVLLAPSS